MKKLDVEDLSVDTFSVQPVRQRESIDSEIILTVWYYYETEQYESCGGSCYSCPCWV